MPKCKKCGTDYNIDGRGQNNPICSICGEVYKNDISLTFNNELLCKTVGKIGYEIIKNMKKEKDIMENDIIRLLGNCEDIQKLKNKINAYNKCIKIVQDSVKEMNGDINGKSEF